jgi:lipopolysaccharide assembly outer membrane protein LptD (OstA)
LVRISATWVALAVVAAAAPGTAAVDAPDDSGAPGYELTCESLEYVPTNQIFVARGSVVMRRGDRVLTSDWMTFSNATRRGVASGNVVLREGDDVLEARFIAFDTQELTGIVFDGKFVGDGVFELSGAEIRKTGDDTYSFEKGVFTSCQCDDPEATDPWTIKAESADLKVGGYGTARNTSFEILGVPAVWFPWMIYPLKTDRQTGFLLPSIGYQGSSVELALPFFWAAHDQVNVILTPAWNSSRGFQGNAELDYVYGQSSRGDVLGSYIKDQDINPNTGQHPYDRNRWLAMGTQDVHLPNRFRAKANFTIFSDNDYPGDFDAASRYRFDRYVESVGFVGGALGSAGRLGLNAAVHWADDLQAPDDTDRDPYLLQRLPTAQLTLLPTPMRGARFFVPALDAEYTYFHPRKNPAGRLPSAAIADPNGALFYDTGVDGMFDVDERDTAGFKNPSDDHLDNLGAGTGRQVTELDTQFQEGEPLDDWGHRLRIAPRLGVPLRLGDVAELYPEVSWYETLYSSNKKGFESRGLFTARADLRTRLRRRFDNGVTHVMEPRLSYALVTQTGQSRDPFFVPNTAIPQERLRELDLENVVRDPADRISRFNGITLGLGNRFFAPASSEEGPRLLADFSLSAGYEFYSHDFAAIYLDGRTFPMRNLEGRFSVGFDPETAHLDEALAEMVWNFDRGYAAVGYRYLRKVPNVYENFLSADRFDEFSNFRRISQLDTNLRYQLGQSWALTYQLYYQIDGSFLVDNTGGVEYASKCGCWSVRVEGGWDRSGGVNVGFYYTLTGLGSDPSRVQGRRLMLLDDVRGVR